MIISFVDCGTLCDFKHMSNMLVLFTVYYYFCILTYVPRVVNVRFRTGCVNIDAISAIKHIITIIV